MQAVNNSGGSPHESNVAILPDDSLTRTVESIPTPNKNQTAFEELMASARAEYSKVTREQALNADVERQDRELVDEHLLIDARQDFPEALHPFMQVLDYSGTIGLVIPGFARIATDYRNGYSNQFDPETRLYRPVPDADGTFWRRRSNELWIYNWKVSFNEEENRYEAYNHRAKSFPISDLHLALRHAELAGDNRDDAMALAQKYNDAMDKPVDPDLEPEPGTAWEAGMFEQIEDAYQLIDQAQGECSTQMHQRKLVLAEVQLMGAIAESLVKIASSLEQKSS
jgi:hypothetical protein